MRWGDTCNLLTKTESVDSQGNLTYTTTAKNVYCNVKSVKYNEYYQAAANGLVPELIIVVRSADYCGEELISYNLQNYKVIRTFVKGENTELTVSKAGVKQMAKKAKVTFESRLQQCKEKIKEKPENALKEIGKLAVSEIKKETPVRTGALKKSCGYWYRKKEKDLQIGYKLWYSVPLILGTLGTKANNFFIDAVMRLVPTIQELIQQALKELEKEDQYEYS